ncbi:hypothetical protein DWX43_22760 [Clostridium sp. AF19-22AC]|nr:hypothetical protein DWX43_22760 [Clostridium sp. AF19-22AC]
MKMEDIYMILNIKDKEFEVHFGIKFIRELDKANYFMKEGAKFGAGLELKVPMLFTYDTVALSEVLYTGTCTQKARPTVNEVDEYVENSENIEALFDEVISELKKGNATRLKMTQMEKELSKQGQK